MLATERGRGVVNTRGESESETESECEGECERVREGRERINGRNPKLFQCLLFFCMRKKNIKKREGLLETGETRETGETGNMQVVGEGGTGTS